jgi:hypothetical protein
VTSTAPSPPTPTPSFADTLEPWCAAGVTGALRLPGRSGGVAYLVDGLLSYAESRYACGLARLLPATGRLSAADVRAAARGTAPMAPLLTGPGLLTPAELEEAVTAALFGAAYFLFDARVELRMEVGARHPIGAVVRVGFDAARREIERRRQDLYQTFPDAALDTTPVVPTRRVAGEGVWLTPLQWEIVVGAVRRRTPVDLARALGRDTYQVLLNVRRLVADGLLRTEPPVVRPDPPTARRRAAARPPGPARPAVPDARGSGRRARPAAATTVLPHRVAGSALALPPTEGEPDGAFPESVLLRIRDALRALA